jgi:hypothetical protein
MLARPVYPLNAISIPSNVLKKAEKDDDKVSFVFFTVLNTLLYILTTVISLPINLVLGLIVIYSASVVILPLIWTEVRV